MASTLACPPGAISTRRSAMPGVSMPATRTGTASARCTSTPWKGSGPCCAPGSARIGASRKTSCRSILDSSSSYTTRAGVGEPCSAPLSQAWLRETAPPPRKLTRAIRLCRDPKDELIQHQGSDRREVLALPGKLGDKRQEVLVIGPERDLVGIRRRRFTVHIALGA